MDDRKKRPLTDRQEAFCVNLIKKSAVYGHASDAYRAAYNCKTANVHTVNCKASALLKTPPIQARIAELRAELAQRSRMEIDDVLQHWVDIATADVNDLVQVRRECCRYCYGHEHHYQWISDLEWARTCAETISAWEKMKSGEPCVTPGNEGGYGFDPSRAPNAACIKCLGNGEERTYITDTRRLSGKARLLYDGIRQTRYGVEIKLRNRDQALENIAKFLGMFKNDEQRPIGFAAATFQLKSVSEATNDPIEASQVYSQIIGM